MSNPISLDLTSSKLGNDAKLFISSTESDFVSTPPPIILIFSDSFVKLTKTFACYFIFRGTYSSWTCKRFSKCSNLVFLSASLTILFLVTLNLQLASLISDLKAVVSDTVNPLICVTIIDCEFKKVLCKLSTNSFFASYSIKASVFK